MTPHSCVYNWLEAFHLAFICHTFDMRSDAMKFFFLWNFGNWAFGFGIIHFNTYLLHLFLVKLVFEARIFQLFILFGEWHLKSSFWKKKTCEEIYRHKSMDVSRSSKTIDQSFMTNLKIYLQQSECRFLNIAHT